MISHSVLQIDSNYIAGHVRHDNVYVDVEYICEVRRLDLNLALGGRGQIVMHLRNCQEYKDHCTKN